MVLQPREALTIDNVRNYPAETVERLRSLLATGAPAWPDPRHQNFYELEGDTQVFYVNLVPGRDKVLLLAAWPRPITASRHEHDRAAD